MNIMFWTFFFKENIALLMRSENNLYMLIQNASRVETSKRLRHDLFVHFIVADTAREPQ